MLLGFVGSVLVCHPRCAAADEKPEAFLLLCQVSELEQPMDEGDRAPLVDSDFPEDTLPEKSANMVQVDTQRLKK